MSENSPLAALAGLFGAVGAVHAVRTNGWLPDRCSMYSAAVGNIKAIRSDFAAGVPMPYGTGRAYDDPAHARLVAISEAMERYSALVFGHRQLVSASAQELGQDALDLEAVPRCSARELRRPGCPLVPADGAADIRWVAATDLTTGRDIFLPAVMVDLGCRRRASERFWLPISTGCATHVTVEAALVNAICELIERDAIALTWLQKLPLPLLDEKFHGIPVREMTQWCADRGIDTYLFDATTDIGVPTVYCVQLADAEYPAAQVVGCATDLDATAAAERALLKRWACAVTCMLSLRFRGATPSTRPPAMARRPWRAGPGVQHLPSCLRTWPTVPSACRGRSASHPMPSAWPILSDASPRKA